jgi:HEAT repeat protein
MRIAVGLGLLLALAPLARAGDDPAPPPAAQHEGKTAAEWTALLSSDDVKLRQKAAYALFQLGKDAAPSAAALVTAIRDADAYVRTTSAKALPRLPADAVKPHVPELATDLSAESEEVRREAASALWHLGPLAADVVPELTKALASQDEIVRANAAGCLGNAGAVAKSALPALEKALSDTDENVRNWAAKAAVGIDAAAAFASPRREVRLAALQAYGDLPDAKPWTRPEIVAGVLRCVDDADSDVRGWAVHALDVYATFWDQRPPEWIAIFKRVLEKDREPAIRSAAAYGLGRYKGRGPDVVPALAAAAATGEAEARQGATLSLGLLGAESRSAIPVLLEALRARDAIVRIAAGVALRTVAEPGDAAVLAALAEATRDANQSVRTTAFWALATLGKGQPATAAELVRCFGDPTSDANTRAAAARRLAEVGVPATAIPPLTAAFEKDPDLPPAVLVALCELDAPCAGKALDRLIAMAEVADPRWDVVGLIGQLGPKAARAVPALRRILSGDDHWRRVSAAESLGAIGAAAKDALPELEKLAQDPDANLARAAKDAAALIRAAPAGPK